VESGRKTDAEKIEPERIYPRLIHQLVTRGYGSLNEVEEFDFDQLRVFAREIAFEEAEREKFELTKIRTAVWGEPEDIKKLIELLTPKEQKEAQCRRP
jgi:hypothetical protein